jgi:hypothetical protein
MFAVTVRRRQTLSDVCLQVYGTIEGIIALARENNLSPSGELEAGTVLQCPDVTYDNYLQDYVRKNGIIPATAYNGRGEIRQRIFTEEFTEQFE